MLPLIDLVVSATAPGTAAAAQVEERFSTRLPEIYGPPRAEIATRRPTLGGVQLWSGVVPAVRDGETWPTGPRRADAHAMY